jgi:hypothetical protein
MVKQAKMTAKKLPPKPKSTATSLRTVGLTKWQLAQRAAASPAHTATQSKDVRGTIRIPGGRSTRSQMNKVSQKQF